MNYIKLLVLTVCAAFSLSISAEPDPTAYLSSGATYVGEQFYAESANEGNDRFGMSVNGFGVYPTSISISPNKAVFMKDGDTYKLSYTYKFPESAPSSSWVYPSATWSSSNTSVVSVTDGTLSAKAPGTAVITVESDNNLSASCNVTVIQPVELLQGNIKQVSVGYYHTMIVMTDGSLWACGSNEYCQLGDGTTTDRRTPVQIWSGGTAVSAVSAGEYHTMIVKTDHSLWACGRNNYGQLCDGTTITSRSPKNTVHSVVAVSAGRDHTMGLGSDGRLWGCGRNNYGQLGNSIYTEDQSTPRFAMSDVSAVSAGCWHTMILKTNGSLWACGTDLSKPVFFYNNYPYQIAYGVSAVSAGGSHAMFVKTDGSLWAWGSNGCGQLGDGTTNHRSNPVQVMTDVSAVSAGGSHTMILKTDGSLWACGSNSNGQLGDGTTIDHSTPVQVMTGVSAVYAGSGHTMILKTDGTLWACGRNDYGQLGDGTNIDRHTPVKIAEGTGGGGSDETADFTDITQYANIIYLEPASVLAGNSVTLPVKMKNAQANITGFQFDIVLPSGVTMAKDEEGFYMVELNNDRTTVRKHTVSAQQQGDGSIRVICYSSNNYTFSGTDGNVLNMALQVSTDTPIGDLCIKLRDVVMTTPNLDNINIGDVNCRLTIEDYILGDVNSDRLVNVVDVAGVVSLILNNGNTAQLNRKAADVNKDNNINVVDVAGVVNIILGNGGNARATAPTRSTSDATMYFLLSPSDNIPQGETSTMHVKLWSAEDCFTGCQFNLYLPEGLSVEEEDGFPLIEIGSGSTTRRHTVTTAVQPDGALLVVCYSNNNYTFNDLIEGSEILTIPIKVAKNAPLGQCAIALRNITLSRPDVTGVTIDDCEGIYCNIVASGIEDVVAEDDVSVPVFSLSGQRLSAPRKGINIIGGKKVVVR